jgi:nucleoid DNA-binding protein
MAKAQDRVFEEIIADLSEEFKLNKQAVRFIIMDYYKQVRKTLSYGDPYQRIPLISVRVPGLGVFKVKNCQRSNKL